MGVDQLAMKNKRIWILKELKEMEYYIKWHILTSWQPEDIKDHVKGPK